MHPARLLFAGLAGLLLTLPFASAAPAQTAGGPPKAAAPTGRPANPILQRVDQHLTELHRQLRITAAQEPQWLPFAKAMHDNAVAMDQKFADRAQHFRTMDAVQNLQSYAAIAQQHAEDMQRLVPAFQTLYGALSPEQKKIADQLWRNQLQHRGPAG
jgi:periplasmic protein CpxP/Spy